MKYIHTVNDLVSRVMSDEWNGRICTTSNNEKVESLHLKNDIDEFLLKCDSIQYGSKVIVKAGKGISTVAAFCAVWLKGGTVIPVDSGINSSGLQKIAVNSGATFLITPSENLVQSLDGASTDHNINFIRDPAITGVDTALIIYTSGSTGTPKGIVLSHQNIISALLAISEYLGLDENDRILCISPLSFDYGLYQVLFSLLVDLDVYLFDQEFTPKEFLKALIDNEISMLPVVPSIGQTLAKSLKIYRKSLPSLRKITNTGGHLPMDTINELFHLIPDVNIYPMYGLTESKRALYLSPDLVREKPGSVGKPMPGLEAMVVSYCEEKGWWQEVESDHVGELVVRGASVMQGYLGHENGDDVFIKGNSFNDRWLRTGDLFSRDEDGYFFFRGRTKELIKQGGYCLYPQAIAEDMQQCPLIESANIIGTNVNGQEMAAAYIVINSKEEMESNEKAIRLWLKENMQPEYIPQILRFIESVPTNANGKVDKNRLAEMEMEQ